MRVHFTNLGCKLNQAELEALARRFVAAGHDIAPALENADLHVINSCTVTHKAARDSRKTARRGRRLRPEIKTVLTGCYVASAPDEAAALTGVDLVVPNDAKDELLEQVHAAFPQSVPAARLPIEGVDLPYVPLEFGNSRGLIKIEDGCNMRCAFCIIPRTRGAQRSRPADDVVREVAALTQGGYREIVLTGVQISAYRHQDTGLHELVERCLDETAVPRLRLTSIAPWQFDSRLLDLFDSGRLCRHFHFSLQSGCDATLARMRRPYSAAAFSQLVDRVRRRVPDVAITTDVIVGFPGETEEEFARSLAFVESLGFSRIHAFPYSARPGTEAASLPAQVPAPETRERMRQMLGAAERAHAAFHASQRGKTVSVLWESCKNGRWSGMSDNYLRLHTLSSAPIQGRLQQVRVRRLDDQLLWAACHA